VGADVDRARELYDRRSWAQAYAGFTNADAAQPLGVEDLERLAASAFLIGLSEEAYDGWGRAYAAWSAVGDPARAARNGFWIGFGLVNSGELARCGGWVDRAQRLLDDNRLDCVEHGYLRYLLAMKAIFSGDVGSALAGFQTATDIADEFRVVELCTLARIGSGRCLIYSGRVDEGVELLDEAMVSVGVDEVSPIAVGDAYCTVIEGVNELFDLRRAQEWTAALSRWCDSQPELVVYRGQCLVHRAELMQLRGAWSDAFDEVKRACDRIVRTPVHIAFGGALYLQGELHRLRGEYDDAEETYRRASELGRDPQPGLACMRLAQGNREASAAAMRRLEGETQDPVSRSRILGPFVEIMIATGDLDAATTAASELEALAQDMRAPFLDALALYATGAARLATGDASGALPLLRRGWSGWRDLDAPYEAARTRVLIAQCCRALGDEDGAEMELDAARTAFAQLGAAPDVARVDDLSRLATTRGLPGGLTTREAEVLVLVARGRTNRGIASELVVSEKTIASHVSHIFTKLGVSSRAAATAWAYENHLV
jgi:DNA-binding CsgD family transcriptional regulator/tetratricopeptide (TPR) repeat protein